MQEIQEALIELFFNLMVTNCSMIPGCLSSLAISLVPFAPTVKDTEIKWTVPESMAEIHTRILNMIEKVSS